MDIFHRPFKVQTRRFPCSKRPYDSFSVTTMDPRRCQYSERQKYCILSYTLDTLFHREGLILYEECCVDQMERSTQFLDAVQGFDAEVCLSYRVAIRIALIIGIQCRREPNDTVRAVEKYVRAHFANLTFVVCLMCSFLTRFVPVFSVYTEVLHVGLESRRKCLGNFLLSLVSNDLW